MAIEPYYDYDYEIPAQPESVKVVVETIAEYRRQVEKLTISLRLLLDNVNYMNGSCRMNEMVGAVLPSELIVRAVQTIRESEEALAKLNKL